LVTCHNGSGPQGSDVVDAGGPPLPLCWTGECEHLMNLVVRQITGDDCLELWNVERRGGRDVGLIHIDHLKTMPLENQAVIFEWFWNGGRDNEIVAEPR